RRRLHARRPLLRQERHAHPFGRALHAKLPAHPRGHGLPHARRHPLALRLMPSGPFYGKYRGTVANNIDPQQMGRIQVKVPAVLGDGQLSWAMPCAPYAGPGVGFFAIPPRDAKVWVEFEGGDPDYPIWVGGFWGLGEAPALPAIAEMKVLKTDTATI